MKHLAQGREIVLRDRLKPVRVKHVVDVDEHVSDVIIPVRNGSIVGIWPVSQALLSALLRDHPPAG